jgi:hypothetical protein
VIWAAGSRSDLELTEDTQEGDPLDDGELDDSNDEPDLGALNYATEVIGEERGPDGRLTRVYLARVHSFAGPAAARPIAS